MEVLLQTFIASRSWRICMVPLSEVYTLHRFRLQTPHPGSEHVYSKLIPTIICSTMIENYFKQKCFKLDSL